jgi:hypothetical protein
MGALYWQLNVSVCVGVCKHCLRTRSNAGHLASTGMSCVCVHARVYDS